MVAIGDVLDFWFADGMSERWFVRDSMFDAEVRRLLNSGHERARDGLLDDWKSTARGCVALCILLDQVPRNLFRDDPRAFATDGRALEVARHALSLGLQSELTQRERLFLYLPLEHSESLEDQQVCVELTRSLDADPSWYEYAVRHREIIERFGRFPHRNAALGRETTAEEATFLAEPNSSF